MTQELQELHKSPVPSLVQTGQSSMEFLIATIVRNARVLQKKLSKPNRNVQKMVTMVRSLGTKEGIL